MSMTIMEAMEARHSVRQYTGQKIPDEIACRLKEEIAACNEESGLHIQLVTDEPKAFGSMMAHYGKFSGVRNYIALVGPRSGKLDELCGYYGERLVLLAQALGLNTCWVAMTFSKGAAKKRLSIVGGEKLVIVISLGYGAVQGVPHKSKRAEDLAPDSGQAPEWFRAGVAAAMLAPTAMNQQKFRLTPGDARVRAQSLGGFCSKIDLGIVKYHFEQGSGKGPSIWAEG